MKKGAKITLILSNTLMSKDNMEEDLDYLDYFVKVLKDAHPKALHGLSVE